MRSSGQFCLNILNPDDGTWHGQWRPTTTIREILLAIQTLLDNPNPKSPSVGHGQTVHRVYMSNRKEWERRTRLESKKHPMN
jgi:ubiquitin-conjugating enzyme E2 I